MSLGKELKDLTTKARIEEDKQHSNWIENESVELLRPALEYTARRGFRKIELRFTNKWEMVIPPKRGYMFNDNDKEWIPPFDFCDTDLVEKFATKLRSEGLNVSVCNTASIDHKKDTKLLITW